MAARLGNVIYWLSFVFAIPAALVALYAWHLYSLHSDRLDFIIAVQTTVLSGGSYLIGRIARYILAGR